MNKIKLIRTRFEAIQFTEKRAVYWNTDLPGFALRVGLTKKVFVVGRKIDGKKVWVTLGEYSPAFTPERARTRAIEVLGELAKGINPNAKKRKKKVASVTLKEALDSYLEARPLKATTSASYRYMVTHYLANWLDHPLLSFTKDQIEKKHKQVGQENGIVPANYSFRILRAVFNYATAKYEDAEGIPLIAVNPVMRLSQARIWFRENTRRDQYVRPSDLPAWFEAVNKLSNDTMQDYLLLLLFTGLRKEDGAGLTWSNVNLKEKTLKILDTKNGEDHILPLSSFLSDMLKRRKAATTSLFVFPGGGASGRLIERKRAVEAVRNFSGVAFTLHDLRRTFASIPDRLVSGYSLKRLLNHKNKGDVTAQHYVSNDMEDLRSDMERISDRILELAGNGRDPKKEVR